jgi:hypothetical protein
MTRERPVEKKDVRLVDRDMSSARRIFVHAPSGTYINWLGTDVALEEHRNIFEQMKGPIYSMNG